MQQSALDRTVQGNFVGPSINISSAIVGPQVDPSER